MNVSISLTNDPAFLKPGAKVAAFVSTPQGERVRHFPSWRAAFDGSAVLMTEVLPSVVRKPYTRRRKQNNNNMKESNHGNHIG